MIYLSGITKKFKYSKGNSCQVFLDANFDMKNYNSVALMGRSGSGKSTLLSIIAGLDVKYSGEYFFKGKLLPKDREKMSNYRMKHIGIITQDYHLLTDRNIFDNIAFPLRCQKIKAKEIHRRVLSVMDLLNLTEFQRKFPNQLSGGQCQRIAIARAVIKNPDLILADEPTGALDEDSEQEVLKALSLLMDKNQSIIIATHSQLVANYCDVEYKIKNQKFIQVR
ncbi:ABC transporter ATP-binding protein [Clostridium sp. D2Q-14]|uniref:ABC transporter ATP-binding protein n=1 Tax=Anaeromonas gelatinilytica TaxID=2683194 RepID=UPI00193C572C|nr:ABC transporter ATP-binding protein [Anaeromonas gelatinilytica]MBS4535522.1 ABC transporter ATP-binding protein [Anaeromonas gelatinilytica]